MTPGNLQRATCAVLVLLGFTTAASAQVAVRGETVYTMAGAAVGGLGA